MSRWSFQAELTSGVCSDAFAGGLLAGIVKGYPRSKCVAMGQWLARLSIQELGPS